MNAMAAANKPLWLAVLVWGLVVISALVQVLLVHWHRDLLGQWQTADSQRMRLVQEHSRLLLEQSTLTAHGRIDQQAREQLQMTEPEKTQVLSQ